MICAFLGQRGPAAGERGGTHVILAVGPRDGLGEADEGFELPDGDAVGVARALAGRIVLSQGPVLLDEDFGGRRRELCSGVKMSE